MDLNNLGKIQRVEVPPFLFTRIKQKIESEKREQMPLRMVFAINLSFAIILMINVMVFMGNNSKSNTTESYAQSIHLVSNNSLYK